MYGTFGFFRLFLATCVVIGHVADQKWYIGRQAVFLFFALSGYVVTYVLCNDYLKSPNGLVKYGVNRFLRIYPLYFVAMLVAIVFAILFPEITRKVDVRYFYISPFKDISSMGTWLANFSLVGLASFDGMLVAPNFVPVAWSIGTEIVYWILVPVLLIFPRLRLLALVIGVVYTLVFVALDYMVYSRGGYRWFYWRYFAVLGALLPFMVGVYGYYLKRHEGSRRTHITAALAALFYLVALAVAGNVGINIYLEGTYALIIVGFFILYYLSGIDSRRLPKWLSWLDNVSGNLAYGVLLFHMLVSLLVLSFDPSIAARSWKLALIVIPLTYIVAAITYCLVEMPIDKVRAKFRAAAR